MSNRKTVPFETTLRVRDHCLCFAAQRAARILARRYDEALRPLGITNGQFSLLMSLNRPKPVSIAAAAAPLAMDRTTLTANLKPLERRGLVASAVDPQDRRGRLLTLTKTGQSLLASAVPIWKRTQAKIERQLAHPDAVRADLRALS